MCNDYVRGYLMIRTFCGLAFGTAVAQVVTPLLPAGDVSSVLKGVETLTLVGVLITGVRVLWVSNQKKDSIISELTLKFTEAMVGFRSAVQELRESTERLNESIGGLPCSGPMSQEERDELHKKSRKAT